MRELVEQDSQFVIATHSPILASKRRPQVELTRAFLDNRERFLRLLFE